LQEALQKEVGMLTSLNHPNLVRFCGVCLDPPLLAIEHYYKLLHKSEHP
jgi:hypothetical protein